MERKSGVLMHISSLFGDYSVGAFGEAARVKDREEVESFIKENKHVGDFCRFMALKEANDSLPCNEQTCDEADDEVLFAWQFIEYEFFTEWQEIRAYAHKKGIKLIGDVPIYVSFDSSDVWAGRNLFLLDADGLPSHVAGVSPDYFCEDGQLWGNPLYNWKEMKKDGYAWWRDRIKHMSGMFDAIRIDHFRGLESFWAVPADAETAKAGKWVKGPGLPFVKAIKEAAGDTQIIAEDLGDITPEVARLVKNSGLPGMKVFQFAFLSDGESAHMPHNYDRNCVAYTGTHDNNTLLGYGADTRMNTPGRAEGNWAYRVLRSQLDSIDREYYKKLNRLYFR